MRHYLLGILIGSFFILAYLIVQHKCDETPTVLICPAQCTTVQVVVLQNGTSFCECAIGRP